MVYPIVLEHIATNHSKLPPGDEAIDLFQALKIVGLDGETLGAGQAYLSSVDCKLRCGNFVLDVAETHMYHPSSSHWQGYIPAALGVEGYYR